MNADSLLEAIVRKLDRGGAPDSRYPDRKGEYWALCPFHADTHAGNFSVSAHGYKCFACGASGGLAKLAEHLGLAADGIAGGRGCTVARATGGIAGFNSFAKSAGAPGASAGTAGGRGCTVARATGGINEKCFSLDAYAQAKRLPVEFLKDTFGLAERKRSGRVAVRMPYLDGDGAEVGIRYRIALDGDKFRWQKGSKLAPYGLWLLDGQAPDVILVEGESDTQTAIYHGIPALGVPGASNWRSEWAQPVAGRTIYAWQEPDAAGAAFVARIGKDLPGVRVIAAPEGYKDLSACHMAGFDIPALVARLKAEARPWAELAAEQTSAEAKQAEQAAAGLLRLPSILAEFGRLIARLGIDRSAGLRRAKVAIQEGYLCNAEDKRGQTAKLTIGEPLPGEAQVLPAPEDLADELNPAIPPVARATVQPHPPAVPALGAPEALANELNPAIPPVHRATVQPHPPGAEAEREVFEI